LKGLFSDEESTPVPVQYINSNYPLTNIAKLNHNGDVYTMAWSTKSNMICTGSSLSTIRVFDRKEWNQLIEIRDKEEKNIESFNVILWAADDKFIIAGGALKARDQWDSESNDNGVIPSPIKIFDVVNGTIVGKLEGHESEVLDIKLLKYNGDNYLLSCGSDGKIIKWKMNAECNKMVEKTEFDQSSETVACLAFFPKSGNRLFAAACDNGIKIFDFETMELYETFDDLYSSICDSIMFVEECPELKSAKDFFWLLTKGVENVDDQDVIEKPNAVHLRQISISKDKFELSLMKEFHHKDYHSNTWPAKLNSNGRYVLSPTSDGKVFIWNLRTGQLTAVLQIHLNVVRQILFHPYDRLIAICGDEATVCIYEQKGPKTDMNNNNTLKEDAKTKRRSVEKSPK